jgi:hypothetical protein
LEQKKQAGNEAFTSRNYEEAKELYSQVLQQERGNGNGNGIISLSAHQIVRTAYGRLIDWLAQ